MHCTGNVSNCRCRQNSFVRLQTLHMLSEPTVFWGGLRASADGEARLEAMKVVSGPTTILTYWFSVLLYLITYMLI